MISDNSQLNQTVEAEVKVIMIPQRVRASCESGEKQIIKWAAEGAVKGASRVFCNVGHTSVAGGMVVSRKGHGFLP